MDATLSAGVVRAGEQARERFYDSRGYGHPVDGGAIELAPVEAAHLLARGDLEGVDGMDFRAFLASAAVSEVAYFVYADLRDRGFYLAPATRTLGEDTAVDFAVFPRGQGPWDDELAYRVRVVGEREDVPASALVDDGNGTGDGGSGTGTDGDDGGGDAVLAIVDEESEITYLETTRPSIDGTSARAVPATDGDLLEDRVVCWDPPADLYETAFYGQRIDETAVQLSLVEAASLASQGTLDVEGGADRLVERGRSVEGERFDRRLAVYAALRNAGLVPKTGFKFGADFRTYADVQSVDELGHSERLVRVLPAGHTFEPRDLALDVRLAHGVRKTMTYAFVDGTDVSWISVERLTP